MTNDMDAIELIDDHFERVYNSFPYYRCLLCWIGFPTTEPHEKSDSPQIWARLNIIFNMYKKCLNKMYEIKYMELNVSLKQIVTKIINQEGNKVVTNKKNNML